MQVCCGHLPHCSTVSNNSTTSPPVSFSKMSEPSKRKSVLCLTRSGSSLYGVSCCHPPSVPHCLTRSASAKTDLAHAFFKSETFPHSAHELSHATRCPLLPSKGHLLDQLPPHSSRSASNFCSMQLVSGEAETRSCVSSDSTRVTALLFCGGDPTTQQQGWRFGLVSPWRQDHTRGSRQDIHSTQEPITMGRVWMAKNHHN